MTTQTKVGVIVITALIILGMLITWKSAITLKFTGYQMIGSFENVEGLTIGSEVRYRGFKVGKVMRIDPSPEDIKVYCVIDKDIKFPSDSSLRVSFDGLVGLKFLEVRPGRSPSLYATGNTLYGEKTSGIVDFVDIASQNLVETKKILIAIRDIVERPAIQNAFINAVMNIEKATVQINRLVEQLQAATSSVNNIVGDKDFQQNIKGTISSTNKTLSSANNFFEGFGKLQLKPSADLMIGNKSNVVKGNINIQQNETTEWLISLGEADTSRNLSLLDLQISSIVANNLGLRIGMIDTHLGGGVDYYANKRMTLSGDLYDINNPKPNYPRVRFTADYKLVDYVNLLMRADNFLNGRDANYLIGIRVKGASTF